MDEDKPTGTYQCVACNQIWDGSEIYTNPQRITCGNLACGANVMRISELPKTEYESLETKADAP